MTWLAFQDFGLLVAPFDVRSGAAIRWRSEAKRTCRPRSVENTRMYIDRRLDFQSRWLLTLPLQVC